LEGLVVRPHVQSRELRWRREADFSLGARVELFLLNAGATARALAAETPLCVGGQTPEQLLADDEWAWHDFPGAWTNQPLVLPPDALSVWSFNGKRAPWGVVASATLVVGDARLPLDLAEPRVWLSAVTFLGEGGGMYPDHFIFHVVNRAAGPLQLAACRLWLPRDNASWRVLWPQPWLTNLAAFPADGIVAAGERGGGRGQGQAVCRSPTRRSKFGWPMSPGGQ
jgi:hypothetical protein